MRDNNRHLLDVAVIGGGPTGISACLELSEASKIRVALFESEPELGGVPRRCHFYFGLRDQKGIYSGPAYAGKLNRLVRGSGTQIYTGTTVLRISPGVPGGNHGIDVVSPTGIQSYESRFILLSTGCFESSRGPRFIPGTRPSGIFTTGALQQIVNTRQQRPGKRAVIIGSEHVALSSALTLKRAGLSIAGLVEEKTKLQTYMVPAKVISSVYNFPIYSGTPVKSILGHKRVEGIELAIGRDRSLRVECDTVILTGKFRPDSKLIDHTPIRRDPLTLGPYVDMNLMTSVPGIFAAGNVLRGAEMHDLCALEGKKAARSILKVLGSFEEAKGGEFSLFAEAPVRFVVPQKISPNQITPRSLSWLFPGFSIQMENTLIRPTLEAWSGNNKIWEKSFFKLIGNSRICLPVHRFDWTQLDSDKKIRLTLKHSTP